MLNMRDRLAIRQRQLRTRALTAAAGTAFSVGLLLTAAIPASASVQSRSIVYNVGCWTSFHNGFQYYANCSSSVVTVCQADKWSDGEITTLDW
ncbi:MAG TPA: hypothetical protein VI248_26575, partial [Kineosporiaceae bacterium]